MDPRTLRYLAAIILFSAIAFAVSGKSWAPYAVALVVFLAIFLIITVVARR
jgi:hypothetical protein